MTWPPSGQIRNRRKPPGETRARIYRGNEMEEKKREVFDIGLYVECDMCGKRYREEDGTILDATPGGLLFGSKGVGPCCSDRIQQSAEQYGEQRYIRDRCPENTSFAEWCSNLRGGENTVTIINFE